MTISYMSVPGLKYNYDLVINPNNKADAIIKKICNFYGIEQDKLLDGVRIYPYSLARAWCSWFIRLETDFSMPKITSLLGVKNHTSIIYHLRLIKSQLEQSSINRYKRDYEILIKII